MKLTSTTGTESLLCVYAILVEVSILAETPTPNKVTSESQFTPGLSLFIYTSCGCHVCKNPTVLSAFNIINALMLLPRFCNE